MGRTRSSSASASTRARDDARAELLHLAGQEATYPSRRPPADRWAIRYLESSRSLPPLVSAPIPRADQVKLVEAQADRIVTAIGAVLDGLELSPELYEHGRKLAAQALRAVAVEGWSPL